MCKVDKFTNVAGISLRKLLQSWPHQPGPVFIFQKRTFGKKNVVRETLLVFKVAISSLQ